MKRKPMSIETKRRLLKTSLKMIVDYTNWDTYTISDAEFHQLNKFLYHLGLSPLNYMQAQDKGVSKC